ncbi:MAG: hypothetical protein PIQ35_13020 [Achromobacter xylosoxidans]
MPEQSIHLPASTNAPSRLKPHRKWHQELGSAAQFVWSFICKHPAVASAGVTALGALTLLTYFLPLGFIPDFDFSDITGLLVIAAFLGIVQLFWLGALLLLPTIFNFSSILPPHNSTPRTRLLIAVAGTGLWFGMFLHDAIYDANWLGLTFAIVVVGGLLLLPLQRTRTSGRYFLAIGSQAIILFYAIVLFHPAPNSGIFKAAQWMQWGILASWCMIVPIANVALVKDGPPSLRAILGVAAYLIFSLLFATHNLSYIHGMTIRKLGLGDVRDAIVTVNDSGAAVIRAACEVKPNPSSCQASEIAVGETKTHAYSNLTILSRMGRQYYLQLCNTTDRDGSCNTNEGLRVVLEKGDVLGWAVLGSTQKKFD